MTWHVVCSNRADAEFGYDPGPKIVLQGVDRATAKSVARHLNKESPWFVSYWADLEKANTQALECGGFVIARV